MAALIRLFRHASGGERAVALVYAGVGVLLWPVPLLGLLHVEAAALVALVAFFAAGCAALGAFARGRPLAGTLVRQEALLLLPWALLTATLLWRPNCGYLQGLLFFGLFPPFSVLLAVALAYALAATGWRWPRLLLCGTGVAVALLGPLYDLGLHPQFYAYNHVFGGVLGPIYDEELAVRPGLFAFRGLTVLWAVLCLLAGAWRRREGSRVRLAVAALAVAAGIGLCHAFAGPLGINTPAPYLRARLGAVHRTPHFDLYYDPAALSAEALRYLAEDHEYHYERLARRLGSGVDGRIESYLYPDAETKGRLTGARLTNVAPVWLATPQLHVLLDAYDDVFAHELAHVFSRTFGLPAVRASVLVGLVEGFAAAMEPPDGLPSAHDQVAAAAAAAVGVEAATLADDLASHLSPLGFWTGRGAVSYTTMGSFVGYLLEAYGAERFARVYAWGDFEAVYGKTARRLAREWQAYVFARPVAARDAGALSMRRFAVPSLFEQPCPHHVPAYRRRYREAAAALAAGDSSGAWAAVGASLARAPAYVPALDLWARLALARGEAGAVAARLDTLAVDTLSAALAVRLGDAWALLGRPGAAAARYEAAYTLLPAFAFDDRALLVLRKALAGRPAALRAMVDGGAPDAVAARLAAAGGDAVTVTLRAVALAAGGHYEQAAALLRTTPAPVAWADNAARRDLLRWQRAWWLARYTHRAGHPAAAAAAAAGAARSLRAAGALDQSARLDAFIDKMRWIPSRRR